MEAAPDWADVWVQPPFVVRWADEWHLFHHVTEGGEVSGDQWISHEASEGAPCDLAAVLEAVIGATTPPLPGSRPATEARIKGMPQLAADDRIAPMSPWVGVVVPGGVAIEAADGSVVVLGPEDLTLLDQIDEALTLDGFAERTGLDTDAAALAVARLRWAGGLRRVAPSTHLPSPEEDPHGAPVPVAPAAADAAGPAIPPEAAAAPAHVPATEDQLTASGSGTPDTSMLAALPRHTLMKIFVRDRVLGALRERKARSEPLTTRPEVPTESPRRTDDPDGASVEPEAPTAAPPLEDRAQVPNEPEDQRVPVFAAWHTASGPDLSLGLLTAAARAHDGGRLTETFDIHRPTESSEVLAALAGHDGPAVLLLSDYIWSIDANLAFAQEAKSLNPEVVVVHGGPSCPKYEGDAEAFFDAHGDYTDILARGEGEGLVCDLLDALSGLPERDEAQLAEVAGISFRSQAGSTVRTPDRERIRDLNQIPSPYLTGEFDHIPTSAWPTGVCLETNRGCPYGCTFCDWGSATNARLRRFDPERVEAEIVHLANRRFDSVFICDANFGITSRDVATATLFADNRRRTGSPNNVLWLPAKNTIKHIVPIVDIFNQVGIASMAYIGMQSMDPATLEAIDRSNISTDTFIDYAAGLRRRGFCLTTDLMIGLPGQTYESHMADYQMLFDLELAARTHMTRVLINSPMNEPSYREMHQIETDDDDVIVSIATADRTTIQRMITLRRVYTACDSFGLLRHVLRWLQWDHGIPAMQVMDDLITVARTAPEDFASLAWMVERIDQFPMVPLGWHSFYDEVRRFLIERYGIDPDDSGLECVLRVQEALMPRTDRAFPSTTALPHDYVEYYRSATDQLYRDGRPGEPDRKLIDYPASTLEVSGDPLDLCNNQWGRDKAYLRAYFQGWYYADAWTNELASPLVRIFRMVDNFFPPEMIQDLLTVREERIGESFALQEVGDDEAAPLPVRVALLPRPRRPVSVE